MESVKEKFEKIVTVSYNSLNTLLKGSLDFESPQSNQKSQSIDFEWKARQEVGDTWQIIRELLPLGLISSIEEVNSARSNNASPPGEHCEQNIIEEELVNVLSTCKQAHLYFMATPVCPSNDKKPCHVCRYPFVVGYVELIKELKLTGQSPSLDIYHDEMVSLIIEEMKIKKLKYGMIEGVKVPSVYFGGGTASFYKERHFESILQASIDLGYIFEVGAELTVEVYPSHATKPYIEMLKKVALKFGLKIRVSIGGTGAIGEEDSEFLKDFGRLHTGEDVLVAIQNCIDLGIDHITTDVMIGFDTSKLSTANIVKNIGTFIKMFENRLHGITTYALEGATESEICFLDELYEQYLRIRQIMEESGRTGQPMGYGGSWWEYAKQSLTQYIKDRWEREVVVLGHGVNSYTTLGNFRVTNGYYTEWKEKIQKNIVPFDFSTGFKFNKLLSMIHKFHYTGMIEIKDELDDRIAHVIDVFLSSGKGKIVYEDGIKYFDIDHNIQLDLMLEYLVRIAKSSQSK
jgi:hypothetical protein